MTVSCGNVVANVNPSMRLSDDAVAKFADIYERVRGIRITVDVAREMATRLITVVELIWRSVGRKDGHPRDSVDEGRPAFDDPGPERTIPTIDPSK